MFEKEGRGRGAGDYPLSIRAKGGKYPIKQNLLKPTNLLNISPYNIHKDYCIH